MSFAYLVSSLQPLLWGNEIQITWEEFLDRVKLNLGAESESLFLNSGGVDQRSLGERLSQWFSYKESLDYEIFLVRDINHKRIQQKHPLNPVKYAPVHDVEEILHAANPLLGQLSYLKLLFKEAEILETGLDWNLEFLGFYGQKLKLLEERQSYSLGLGVAALENWAETNLKQNFEVW